jgi:Bacterial protein of unknown function (DUF885)
MKTPAGSFSDWLDRFFDSYYRHRPVNATFIGNHEHDDRLPERSDSAVDALVREMAALRAELDAFSEERLAPGERLDARLARGFLEIETWELDSGYFHRQNPAWYTGEAIFGIFSLLLRDFAPLPERLRHARSRLAEIPRLLEEAERNLRAAPRAWSERAIRECESSIRFLDAGVFALPGAAALGTTTSTAKDAFVRYRQTLEQLVDRPAADPAAGEEAFALLLRKGHFLEETAESIASRAERALSESLEALASGAGRFGVRDFRDALALLERDHPSREGYYERYRELWEESRALAREKNLISWPDYPVNYVPQPPWARTAAPGLYFLFYRSPAPLDPLAPVDYLVTPLEPGMPAAEAEQILRATNDSVIKLNHVVHHGGLGHHIQNWHARKAPSRLGRVAAVDCASRIAMFCGGTMAEGWASYATDVMNEAGFLTPLEAYAEHHAHARAAARAIVDVKLHSGAMPFDAAVRFYQEKTSMGEKAARSEAAKNSMFPGAAVIYFVGSGLIHELRRELQQREGDRFRLRDFHDRFLAHGSIPVTLVGQAMRASSR